MLITHTHAYTTPQTHTHVCPPKKQQAAAAHVACARQKGWTLPVLQPPAGAAGAEGKGEGEAGGGAPGAMGVNADVGVEAGGAEEEPWTMAVRGLLPYWMPRGTGGVENSVNLRCVCVCGWGGCIVPCFFGGRWV